MSDIETFEEFCNNNNCSTCRLKKIAIEVGCSNCEKHFMREHDKQIRENAIDEFTNKMIVMLPGHRQDILAIAEKLKEQK